MKYLNIKMMRGAWCVMVLAAMTLAAPVQAQDGTNTTNGTNAPVATAIGGDLGKLGSDFGAFFKDAEPYFTNSNFRAGVNGMYVNHKWGGFMDVVVPINDQVGVGFAAAYLGGEWYDASVGLNLGMTKTLPLIGVVRLWGESGPGYNFNTHSAIVQSSSGATKKWAIGKAGELAVNAGIVHISDQQGVGGFLGISYNMKF